MQALKKFITAIILFLPFTALAHGYWIELEGSHKVKEPVVIKLIFGEYILAEKLSGDKLDRMKEIRVFVLLPDGKKQAIGMKQEPGCWRGTFTPATEGSFSIIGINDEREVQDWTRHGLGITRPIQYLKAIYEVGKSSKEVSSPIFLDVDITKKAGGQFEAQLLKGNKAFESFLITVVSPGGNEEELKTNEEGKALFSTKEKGLYLIGVQWIDDSPGIFKEKEYKTVRHKLDYSLYIQ